MEADISWCRPPTDEELTHEWIHAYDRSGSYLAGVSGLELGVGAPIHHPDGTTFVPRMPGYWRVEIPETGDWRMPHPLDPRGLHAGKVRWVTTPAMEFAGEAAGKQFPALRVGVAAGLVGAMVAELPTPDRTVTEAPPCDDPTATLLALLAHPNIASKEHIIRRYDHEIRGATVVRMTPHKDGKANLTVCADPAWLADPARVYPVYIDPAWANIYPYYDLMGINKTNRGDTFCNSANPTLNFGSYYDTFVGAYVLKCGNTSKNQSDLPGLNKTLIGADVRTFFHSLYYFDLDGTKYNAGAIIDEAWLRVWCSGTKNCATAPIGWRRQPTKYWPCTRPKTNKAWIRRRY